MSHEDERELDSRGDAKAPSRVSTHRFGLRAEEEENSVIG
jgi:hypothetical protein